MTDDTGTGGPLLEITPETERSWSRPSVTWLTPSSA